MRLLILSFLLLSVKIFAQEKTHWSPEQTLRLKNISSIQVSPDGNKIVYSIREAVMTDERSEYVNQVYLAK